MLSYVAPFTTSAVRPAHSMAYGSTLTTVSLVEPLGDAQLEPGSTSCVSLQLACVHRGR